MKKHTKRLLALALVALMMLPLTMTASANTAAPRTPFFSARISNTRNSGLYRLTFRGETGATITDHMLAYFVRGTSSRHEARSRHSLGRNHTQFTGSFSVDSNVATVASFYGDGRLLRTVDIPAFQIPETIGNTSNPNDIIFVPTGFRVNFSVNVTGVRHLEIRIHAPNAPASGRTDALIMLANATLGTAPYDGRIEGPELTSSQHLWHNVQRNWRWIVAGVVAVGAVAVVVLANL
ncbi:MAG: hypothetical protein FWB76_05675 [Oscillospiraceae bacterium]|nr:hypothetical protein [Oscillospiraceae bacterium]